MGCSKLHPQFPLIIFEYECKNSLQDTEYENRRLEKKGKLIENQNHKN